MSHENSNCDCANYLELLSPLVCMCVYTCAVATTTACSPNS